MNKEQNDLPPLAKGWIWTTSSDVCSSVRDGTHDTPKYVQQGLPLITSKNLKPDGLDFLKTKNISLEDHEKIGIRSKVEERDILFAMIGTIGNPVVVNTKREFSIKNVGLFKKNEQIINSDFLRFWLSSSTFMKIIRDRKLLRGTTQKFISLGNLRILPIPLPPLNEQRRIIDKLEELFTRLDAGVASLQNVKVQLQLYRQAVLKHAFNGKLTDEWRKNHKDALEPAYELLKKITEKKESFSKKRFIKRKTIFQIKENESELPNKWIRCKLSDITILVTDGKHGDCKNQDNSNYYFLSAKDIVNGKLDYSNARQITKNDFLEVDRRTNLQLGDILLSNSGSIGKIAVADNSERVRRTTFQKSVAVIKLVPGSLSSEFIVYQLKYNVSGLVKASRGTAQMNLLLRDLRDFKMIIPPLSEQKQIVEEINNLFSISDEVETITAQNLLRAKRLRTSILKVAFEGKLVSQDPTDKPAELHLERIKQKNKI